MILGDHADILAQAGIYGAIAVSRYPYDIEANVLRTFVELWSPLTNTLHFGGGEMSISLHNLKTIGGLPISGVPYEEFLPPNEHLTEKDEQGNDFYPSTISELLIIHTKLCRHLGTRAITRSQWIDYFHRGEIVYGAYGELPRALCLKHNLQILDIPFKASRTGILAA